MVCSSTLQQPRVCGRILDINPIRYTKKSPVQSEREILIFNNDYQLSNINL